jgi:hypothetical protein
MKNNFFSVIEYLFNNESWLQLPISYKMVFIRVLSLASESKFLEVCVSERKLAELCGDDMSDSSVRRALNVLEAKQFVKRKVKQQKTEITITQPGVCELFSNKGEAESEAVCEAGEAVLPREDQNPSPYRYNIYNTNNKYIAQSPKMALRKTKTDPIFFCFESGLFMGITDADRKSWKIAYPSIDLAKEIHKAQEWIKSNPTKANKRLWRKFLTGWLQRASDYAFNRMAYQQPRTKQVEPPPSPKITPLTQEEIDYYAAFEAKL